MAEDYVIEMLHITKEFPGIKANDDITLQLRRGEVHALLGENGAGKSTLMSVLFGLYQPEQGTIRKNGKEVQIRDPNDANALGIGMVHQHFKLVECFSVLDNIILGVEPNKLGFLQKAEARKKVMALSEKYGLRVDPDALVSDISVGMQQRVEILKMLYRDNEILIFDEPTAVLTPQEIDEKNILWATMAGMERAVAGLDPVPAFAVVDGNRVPPQLIVPALAQVKGDGVCASVAAASILAKVSRDRYMLELDRQYPQYQLAKHKGYPTKLHYELLERYGIQPFYRRSFLKKLGY